MRTERWWNLYTDLLKDKVLIFVTNALESEGLECLDIAENESDVRETYGNKDGLRIEFTCQQGNICNQFQVYYA